MLRKCLNGVKPNMLLSASAFLVGLLTLLLVWGIFPSRLQTSPSPHLAHRVIIIGGGTAPNESSCIFYLDIARVYETLLHDLQIPAQGITVLYADGAVPNLYGPDDPCFEGNDLYENVPHNEAGKQWQACQDAVAQLQMHPPIRSDTRKTTIMATVRHLLLNAPEYSQVWIFRSGHGEILIDSSGVHSSMQVMDNASISDNEWGEILRTPTRASQIILFLNQCQASGFLNLPATNPRLVVYTACGAHGPDYAYLLYNQGPEWTWSKAWRDGFSRTTDRTKSTFVADANQDRRVDLNELYQFILNHDAAAHEGILPRHDGFDEERIYSKPGFAWGGEIDPAYTPLIEE